MYLHHVFNDFGAPPAGGVVGSALDGLPTGLAGYYQGHWAKMRSRDAARFDAVHRRVVCVLAAAREAVLLDEVAAWSGLDLAQVRQVTREWREFLYAEPGPEGQVRYRLYHTTFREFLAAEVDIDLREHKGMIADAILTKVRRLRPR